jgi:hypothetical protein
MVIPLALSGCGQRGSLKDHFRARSLKGASRDFRESRRIPRQKQGSAAFDQRKRGPDDRPDASGMRHFILCILLFEHV